MPKDQNITRKLKAILSADVKGYSLLMSDDEVLTLKTLNEYRDIMSDLIHSHSGRVVDAVGDNLLAEFSSAVDAVDCAVKIQDRIKKENSKFVEDKRLQFRIGINIGDVIHDGDRIVGEGVNIAARIESLADAGGICISRNTHDQVKNKLQIETKYLGGHEVKNIKEPVRVYEVLIGDDAYQPLVEEKLELPEKPSIAVLPFTNMSGDLSQEYFSDGLTEQIINGLCKIPDLFVIARNSSFAYKGKAVSVKQIAIELGVKYILEGSVQRAGNRVRITAQLIDAETDFHMWSENYDRDLSDIFVLQDEITMELISEMRISLTSGEQARNWSTDTTLSIKAFDKVMRAMDFMNRFTKDDNMKVLQLCDQAIHLDDNYATPYVMKGFSYWLEVLYGWSQNPLNSIIESDKNAKKAIALTELLDGPYLLLGSIHLINHHHEEAIKECKKALAICPNGANAYAMLAGQYNYAGHPEKGLNIIKRAIRLNPVPYAWYYIILGTSYRMIGDYKKAIFECEKSLRDTPDYIVPHLILASSYAGLGNGDKAQKAVKEIFRIDPNYSLEMASITPYKRKEDLDTFISLLRKAGVPEHPPK